ncbi:MAG: acyltransferase 3 [Defluviitaleaceae bacterium]|jgi:peptidoglycan/LPS O-acetylase OafA/YrhL|nr:acyltransferase 3 [Defluviitaleaceae bacterium]
MKGQLDEVSNFIELAFKILGGKSVKKQWIPEIQAMRGILILCVVLIHVLYIPISRFDLATMIYGIYYGFNRVIQFAVPGFILIASILITYNLEQEKMNVLKFYKRKIHTIVMPYLFWSIVYILCRYFVGAIEYEQLISVSDWAFWILFGKSYSHLYFMSVIIQVYLLAPVLIKFIKKVKKNLLVTFLIGTAMQIIFYWINKFYIYKIFPYPATLFYWHFIIIWLGLWIGFNYHQCFQIVDKYFRIIIFIWIFSMAFYIKMCFDIELGKPINTFIYQMIWYIYVFLASIIILRISRLIDLKGKSIKVLFNKMGKYSFSIYLIHPFVVTVIKDIVRTSHPVLLTLFTIVSPGVIIVVSIITDRILQRMKRIILFHGNYNVAQRRMECKD